MRLSEREQRLLADVERALTRDDPSFAQQFTSFPQQSSCPRRRWRRVLRLLRLRRG
jgi:Protein of unknown function (DUF3040)